MDTVKTPQKSIIGAVEENKIEVVAKALERGIDVNTQDESGKSLLLIATQADYVEMVELLLRHGADVNLQDNRHDSAFLYAGAAGQTNFLELFLKHGARFDVYNRYNGTALIPACERGHVETVRLLANTNGFPIDHINRLGWTALMEAIVLGDGSARYIEIVQILVDAGCDTLISDKDGIFPLQHAERLGYTEILKILQIAEN